jgi:hypothetical protein
MVPVVWGSDWATPSSGDCQAKAYEHEHDLMQTNHERGGKKNNNRPIGGVVRLRHHKVLTMIHQQMWNSLVLSLDLGSLFPGESLFAGKWDMTVEAKSPVVGVEVVARARESR